MWSSRVEDAVRAPLEEVQLAEPERDHLGRPYRTAYQLAIKVHRLMPELADQLGVGGEGALLSNADVSAMSFRHPDGGHIDSSNISAGYDLALFRLRE